MGVWPCGAQVLTTLGINRKPDSSAKTKWAPSRAAFFLSAASLSASSARWLLHPAPGRAVPASAGSIANCASTGRHDRGDTGLRTRAGSLPQCGPWSTDWSGSPARSALAEANRPSVFVAVGSSFRGRPGEKRTRNALVSAPPPGITPAHHRTGMASDAPPHFVERITRIQQRQSSLAPVFQQIGAPLQSGHRCSAPEHPIIAFFMQMSITFALR